jgi:hypothetical protein
VFSGCVRLDRERKDHEKVQSHDRVQTAVVLSDLLQHHPAPNDRVQTVVDDLRPDGHPRWRQCCLLVEHTLPPDEKTHRPPNAILR